MITRALRQSLRRVSFPVGRRQSALPAVFERFVRSVEAQVYAFHFLDNINASPQPGHIYLRHDVKAKDLARGLKLARLHQELRIPGTFHIAWDLMDGAGSLERLLRHYREFDSRYVRLGLQCDPVTQWLARSLFADDLRKFERFVRSSRFVPYLGEMLALWRKERGEAPALRTIREGAWDCLAALDHSFREVVGQSSSISGRGSRLSDAFNSARQAQPELGALASWFSSIDFLSQCDLKPLGYRFEATRFMPDGRGPVVVFGGADIADLREELVTRLAGGGGVVAIFPASHWDGRRYADLLPHDENGGPHEQVARLAPAKAMTPELIPAEPFITREKHLFRFGRHCERVDKGGLAAASRHVMGGAIDYSFPRFVEWLRAERYVFDSFESGRLRFGDRRAYLRYDVHIQDLLAAYVLADLHERLEIVGSFQIMWKFSAYEEALEPYFTKLLEFDRRFVGFGLHAAPTASWYSREKLGGDCSKQADAVTSEDFAAWLLDLQAAYRRDGPNAPGIREIREGTDDTLSQIAASFRATFGRWRSISAHGNYLTNGFVQVCKRYPEVAVLRPYFHPVEYLVKWGVMRFGFDYEITALGSDEVPFPRVMLEGNDEETRRRHYRGRIAHGAGFVALLHPATWTCRHNATFFLPKGASA